MKSLIALALLSPSLVAQSVLVVDDDLGPGVDHTEIQAAVDAAGDGTLILVRSGEYSPFTISGRALSVVEDEGADAVVTGAPDAWPVRISGVTRGRTVLLHGLTLRSFAGDELGFGGGVEAEHLALEDSDGTIWLQEVSTEPVSGPLPFVTMDQAESVRIANCDRVTVTGCAWRGSTGGAGTLVGGAIGGARGCTIESSTVAFFDCTVRAGAPLAFGFPGAPGLRVLGSTVSARASTFLGASGVACNPAGGSNSTSGGAGFEVLVDTSFYAVDSVGVGGPGGGDGLFCSTGPDGLPSSVDGSSTLVEHVASTANFATSATPRDDVAVDFAFEAEAGSVMFLLAAPTPNLEIVPSLPDGVAVGLGPIVLTLGTTDASGNLSTSFGSPDLPMGIDALPFALQAAALTPSTGLELSNPVLLSLVQETY